MDRQAAKALHAGSEEHYSSYVGPPEQYDFMGAMQFRLACSLGLREHHKLLDFGCGSLRAGRLLLVYLNAGNYFGIEPNDWLVKKAIDEELGGEAIIRLKRPSFSTSADFDSRVFGETFDFIIAQSIFSHAGLDLIEKSLGHFRDSLKADGVVMATFLTPPDGDDFAGDGWVYPGCVSFREDTVTALARALGLASLRIPFFHPRQDWYLFSKNPERLPSSVEASRHLTGHIFGATDLVDERPVREDGKA